MHNFYLSPWTSLLRLCFCKNPQVTETCGNTLISGWSIYGASSWCTGLDLHDKLTCYIHTEYVVMCHSHSGYSLMSSHAETSGKLYSYDWYQKNYGKVHTNQSLGHEVLVHYQLFTNNIEIQLRKPLIGKRMYFKLCLNWWAHYTRNLKKES